MEVIKVTNLTKYYGNFKGIEGVNFSVSKGEIFGFIGPNGAGKSTTIRCLLNLIYPTSGEIKINGMDSVRDSIKIKNMIGYLPSECNFYSDMKVNDFLEYMAQYYKGNFKERINNLSDRLQLDVNKKIEELSYGNKKKVGIVQAFINNPEIIILDEPTGGLDPLIQEEFYKMLEEEKAKGKTIFFSSHILSEVQRLCDRVAIVKDGAIIKIETIEALRNQNIKKVRLKSNNEIVINLHGVKDFSKVKDNINFIFKGDIDKLIKQLAGCKIEDISIEEPTLEEIFMNYYE